MQPMKTVIIGAGAIGTLVGSQLAHSGCQVTLVGRERFVAAVEAHGLRVENGPGDAQVTGNVCAVDTIDAAFRRSPTGFDVAVFAVKSYDTEAVLADLVTTLQRYQVPTPLALSLQNGVGNEALLAAALESANVAAGVITTPVSVLGPAHIRVDKPKYLIGLSRWQVERTDEADRAPADASSMDSDAEAAYDALRHALGAAGFVVVAYEDARSLKWTKLLMNMVGNATSAILDMPPAEAFGDAGIVDLEIEAWREALAVMRACDIEPVNLGGYPFAKLAPWIRRTPKAILRPVLRHQVSDARGGKMPSLHIDLYKDRGKSEIAWLNGAVVEHGRACQAPTPVNQALVQALTCLVHDAGKRALWRRNSLRLIVSAREFQERQSG